MNWYMALEKMSKPTDVADWTRRLDEKNDPLVEESVPATASLGRGIGNGSGNVKPTAIKGIWGRLTVLISISNTQSGELAWHLETN